MEQKKNNLLIILLLLLLIASCGFIVYDKFVKKNEVNGNNTKDTMSSELAVAVAKEKLYEANTFFGSFDSILCDKENIKDDFYCYYGSLSKLENKFYEIYSSKLSLKDVFFEYDSKTKKIITNVKRSEFYDGDRVAIYLHSGSEVWVDNSCRASGVRYDIIDYKLESVTKDRIEVSYIERDNWEDYLFSGQVDGKTEQELKVSYNDLSKMAREKMVIVNENNEWKILSANINDNCGIGYNVGK